MGLKLGALGLGLDSAVYSRDLPASCKTSVFISPLIEISFQSASVVLGKHLALSKKMSECVGHTPERSFSSQWLSKDFQLSYLFSPPPCWIIETGRKKSQPLTFCQGLWLVMSHGPYIKLVIGFLFTSLAFMVILCFIIRRNIMGSSFSSNWNFDLITVC